MEVIAKINLSQYLLASWQVDAEVALSTKEVEALYEEEVRRHVQMACQQQPESWKNYTEEARLEARNKKLQHSQATYREKCTLAEFRKEYETKRREVFLLQKQTQQEIPADVLVAFLENQVYIPPGSELASQYGWEESEHHGSQERWGIWLKKDSTEKNMDGTVRHRRFDDLARELKGDAQRDQLIQNPYYFVHKGNELLQDGRAMSAAQAYRRAIALDPPYSANARFNLARALLNPEKNKRNHSEAKRELKQVKYLISAHHKNALLSFDTLVSQTGKKPRTPEHVQHQLDILGQQENYIQAAIDVIERAQEKDWDVEITEIKAIQEVFAEAEGNRKQALDESAANGFIHVFTIKEKEPKKWGSIIAVALIGLAQLTAGYLLLPVPLAQALCLQKS
jgi:tetratricopeptide (TPR) repeat protein